MKRNQGGVGGEVSKQNTYLDVVHMLDRAGY